MQIVTRGKRAQTEIECLSSVMCIVGRLRAKACGGADLRLEAPFGAASKARGAVLPSCHMACKVGGVFGAASAPRGCAACLVLIPLLLAH